MTRQIPKAILIASLLAWMAGCTGGTAGRALAPPQVEDRPPATVAEADSESAAGESDPKDEGTTGTLTDSQGIEGDPLSDSEGANLTLVVYFEFDSSEIHPADRIVVEAHAQYLSGRNNLEVVLEGHADERGSREYNVALAERRANGVRDMLRLLGVADDQVRTVSYGEERPAATGHDEESWSRNRRVEFAYIAR